MVVLVIYFDCMDIAFTPPDVFIFNFFLQIGQLYHIFQLLGTPDDTTWPGVTCLPDWQPLFPRWQALSLAEVRRKNYE